MTLIKGRYRIIETIGVGGYGETFLTVDEDLPSKRKCVVKQLKPLRGPATEEAKERFKQEARVLEKLGNENDQIPKLYAYFEEADEFYLVLEYIPGKTVRQLIKEKAICDEEKVRRFLVDFLPVLDFIHKQKIIHRDIKPDNIIIRDSDGKPVLIDFGLVKEVFNSEIVSHTVSAGTVGFMAFEQMNGMPVYASDVFSVGKTAIAMLTPGFQLKPDSETGEIYWKNLVKDTLSGELGDILDKATEIHTKNRFRTAKEMFDALKEDQLRTRYPGDVDYRGPLLTINPGKILQNRFTITKLLGRGGMAYVYLAKDAESGFDVAIKQSDFTNELQRQAYIREASLLKGFNHPNIPKFFGQFEVGSQAFIVMDFITGKNLSERLNDKMEEDGKPFPVDLVLKWTNSLLETLHYLHSNSQKVIHRDIKPTNLKESQEGKLFLLDFGLAQLHYPDTTRSELVNGETLGFSPPEQSDGTGTDERSDLYSVGATMYQLLTGSSLPSSRVRVAELSNSGSDPLPPLTSISPDIPLEIVEVINKALSLSPDDRPQTAMEMLSSLFQQKNTQKINTRGRDFLILASEHDDEFIHENEFDQLINISAIEKIPIIHEFSENFPVRMVEELFFDEKKRCSKQLNSRNLNFDFACLEATFLGGLAVKDFIIFNKINDPFNLSILFESKAPIDKIPNENICLILIYKSGAIRTKSAKINHSTTNFSIEIFDSSIFFDPNEEKSIEGINDFQGFVCLVPFFTGEVLFVE